MSGTLHVCPKDGEPVVFTFEFPGAEYYCVTCGGTYGIFGAAQSVATEELVDRHEVLSEQYRSERAARTGVPIAARSTDAPHPVCSGCGAVAKYAGKPPHWFVRTVDGEDEFACSTDCITDGAVLPW